jgi:dTDP-4-dehydrorhamnose 3,5-epimerase
MDKISIKKLEVKSDERGWLVELVRNEDLDKKEFGQIYVTTAFPGKVKANHYHTRKTEWFCVIKGKGMLFLKKLGENKVEKIIIGDDNLIVVKIPPKTVHAIKNIGEDVMYLISYVDEPHNPNDTDTIKEVLME